MTYPLAYPGPSTYPGTATSTGGTSGGSTAGSGSGNPPAPTSWSSADGRVTVTFDYKSWPPRAAVFVNWPGMSTVMVSRQDPSEELGVRHGTPATLDSSGTWLGYDYEMPYGNSFFYDVLSPDGLQVSSVRTGIFDVPQAWRTALIHPQAPSMSTPILLGNGSGTKVTRAARQASLTVLGRPRPVIRTDVRASASSQLVVLCRTVSSLQALDSIISDGSALRLNVDTRLGLGINSAYVAIGDVDYDANWGLFNPDRSVTLPYVEVDMPTSVVAGPVTGGGGAGGTGTGSGFWTYAAAEAAYSTYAAAEAAFSTYANAEMDKVG